MSKSKYVFEKEQSKLLEVIKKNIDKENKEKRRSFEKLLSKMAIKIYSSKLH